MNNDNLLKKYTQSLKSLHAEELVDVYFFRPMAFVIVQVLYPLPLTPNHYSFLSLLSGVIASFFFLQGDAYHLKIGALYFLLSSVLDCCDGMVARLKKNGTPFGKVIDGVVDYLVNICVFVSLSYGLSKSTSFALTPLLLIPLFPLAGLSKIFHSLMYDFYLTEYLNCESKNSAGGENELKRVENYLANQGRSDSNIVKTFFLNAYLLYLKAQNKIQPREEFNDPETYCRLNLGNLRKWSFIGPSMHNLVLILALLCFAPSLYFFYSIVFGNLWLLIMYVIQNKNRKFLLKEESY